MRCRSRNLQRSNTMSASIEDVIERLARIEQALQDIVQQRAIKEWYTTSEVAELLNRAEWTVREWARLGRIRASKRQCGRGNSQEWIVSHEELQRVRNEGLRPDPRAYHHPR